MKKTNNDTNYGKPYQPSPAFTKNKGRLARLPLAERKRIARKGGLAKSKRKKLSNQINSIKTGKATKVFSIINCDDCQIKEKCLLYRKGLACQIELNLRRNIVRQFKAFVGDNPEDMLKEIMRIYKELEKVVKSDPSFYKISQLLYLLLNIYKMKFGEKSFVNFEMNKDNPSTDIKKIMKKIHRGGSLKD